MANAKAKTVLAALALLACAMLGGCASLLGGGEKSQSTLYAPDPRIAADPSWPTADWQLSVSRPSSARMTDTLRISVRPTPDEVQVYKGAAWAKLPSDLVEDTLTRALEDSGRINAIARQGTGVAADYKLVMDLRRFEADYAGNALPSATIEINAKLLHTIDQGIVGSRTFLHAEPAATANVKDVVDAFTKSLTRTGADMALWVLQTGNAHEASAHADGAPAKRHR
ncbi:MAG: ABC-type transport auxiliary lipoprotein family protein [Luteimonas sp.]